MRTFLVVSSRYAMQANDRGSQLNTKHWPLTTHLGLLGFDSKDDGFVSMQADAPEALKTDAKR